MTKYKVTYDQKMWHGSKKRGETVITYDTKSDAQKYADQINRGNGSFSNARVKKV